VGEDQGDREIRSLEEAELGGERASEPADPDVRRSQHHPEERDAREQEPGRDAEHAPEHGRSVAGSGRGPGRPRDSLPRTEDTEMPGRLEGRVALITGGASGMGRATALRFLGEGARVVIADLNEGTGKETLEALAAGAGAEGAGFVRAAGAQEDDVEAMVALALREFGRLDCLFNNAGLGGALGPITETEVEDWDFTFAVLVRGVFLGTKHGARAIRAGGRGGSIVNTASVAGLSGGAGPAAYSAAKAAVIN